MTCIFTWNVTLPQVFFKHFASKNQLPDFYISETLVENGLKKSCYLINESYPKHLFSYTALCKKTMKRLGDDSGFYEQFEQLSYTLLFRILRKKHPWLSFDLPIFNCLIASLKCSCLLSSSFKKLNWHLKYFS